MHPYIAEVIAAERAKDMRARAARVQRSRQASRARRGAGVSRKPGAASLAALPVSWRGQALRRASHSATFEPAAAGCAGGQLVR